MAPFEAETPRCYGERRRLKERGGRGAYDSRTVIAHRGDFWALLLWERFMGVGISRYFLASLVLCNSM